MADKFQNKYRISSARAVWHDYNDGDYFITICTCGRELYFGEIVNDVMMLNVLGQKLNELILDIPTHNPYAEIPVYQVMPNHVHLIVCIDEIKMILSDCGADAMDCTDVNGTDAACRDEACHVSTNTKPNEKMQKIADKCGLLSTAMGGMKSALTKYAHTNKIEFGWQTRFHDHIIRDGEEWNRIATYIENNPTKWVNDKFYTE